MKFTQYLIMAAAAAMTLSASAAKSYQLTSPLGNIAADIECASSITYSVTYDGKEVLSKSPLSMTLSDGTVWGKDPRVAKASRTTVNTTIASPFAQSAEMKDNYNGLTLKMKGDWSLEFRAYDDGVAYRFVSDRKKPFEVVDEQAEFIFPGNYTATVPYVRRGTDDDLTSQFFNSFESSYTTAPLAELNPRRLAFLPLAVDAGENVRAVITETDLRAYPGMFLYNPDGSNSLKSKFAPYPTVVTDGAYNNIQGVVTERADYIAKIDGPRTFPWRVIVVGPDKVLAETNLSYLLAEPSRVADISWIKPGKVAWDWWNAWNLKGVDFEAGINTPTYKYYIDFASNNGIEYVILDDGWAVGNGSDLMKINPAIDLQEIIDYGKSKNVDIILWAGFRAFERDMEEVCRHYSEMGVKGFKVDFLDRDDQLMTDFCHKAAETAARYNLVLDLHGAYKPAGINRTWPNVLNVEGVLGLENAKWSDLESFDIITYDTQLPFIRQIAGPMDYTQGAMTNGARSNFRPLYYQPMSPGTRAHQMGLYMILYSPLNMLCDAPTNYEQEQECTDFIAAVPTVWDETIMLDGKMGEYVVTARRNGNDWFIGGVNNWTPRDITLDLSQLNIPASANVVLFTDGKNARRNGNDYKRQTLKGSDLKNGLKVHMAPGGGFAASVTR